MRERGGRHVRLRERTYYNKIDCSHRYPIVSMGVFRWVEATVVEPSFFEVSAETSSLFLVLLDEVQAILLIPLSFLIFVFYLDGIISFFTTSFYTRITPKIARGLISLNGSTDAGTIEENNSDNNNILSSTYLIL